jgi:hypothetical protein
MRLNDPTGVICAVKQLGLAIILIVATVSAAGADTPEMISPGIAGEGVPLIPVPKVPLVSLGNSNG